MSVDLMVSVLADDAAGTAALLDAGADPNCRLRSFWTSTLTLKRERECHPDVLRMVLRMREQRPESPLHWTWTPLLLATACGGWEVAELLLDRGADPRAADEIGATPLLFAVRAGRAGLVRALLARGADAEHPF